VKSFADMKVVSSLSSCAMPAGLYKGALESFATAVNAPPIPRGLTPQPLSLECAKGVIGY